MLFLAKERIIGWYHTGPKLHPNDIRINELIRRFNPNSVSDNTVLLNFFKIYLDSKIITE